MANQDPFKMFPLGSRVSFPSGKVGEPNVRYEGTVAHHRRIAGDLRVLIKCEEDVGWHQWHYGLGHCCGNGTTGKDATPCGKLSHEDDCLANREGIIEQGDWYGYPLLSQVKLVNETWKKDYGNLT